MAPGTTATVTDMRAKELARILIHGGKRSDCEAYAAKHWQVSSRQVTRYMQRARQMIYDDWKEVDRAQMVAEVLSRYSTLEMEARRQNNLAVVLGCIHGAAKVALIGQ
jgi:predicted secreted Zn-dependent protease